MDGSAAINGFLSSLHHLDKDVTLAINALHCPASDAVWQVFSAKVIWFVLYAVIIVFFFIRLGWKRALIVIASAVLCVVACDQFANLVKFGVQRLRPVHDAEMMARGLHVLENPGQLYGFFSAHAANATGFAVCSLIGFRNDKKKKYTGYGVAICLWAFLVGMSRVFVGKHFFGDVMVGFAVGILFGLVCGLLGAWCCRKFAPGR